MTQILAFIVAMAGTVTLIPVLTRWAGAMRVLDVPGGRKAHSAVMPRVGGMAMMAGVALAMLFWMPRDDPRIPAYLLGAGVIFLFGVWDDRADLPPAIKLAGQLIGTLIVALLGDVHFEAVTLVERHLIPTWIGVPLTVLFIMGVTNAINLADGLDGLAGGTTLLSAAAMSILAHVSGNRGVEIAGLALCGALLGFLRFNTWPARVFMGDAGSQFLGFSLAVLALLVTQGDAQPFSAAVPVMFLGLPIVDTVTVMARRLREGRSPFSADRNHLHHKLLGLGFDHHEAVAVIYTLQAAFFVAGWLVRYEPDTLILGAFVLMAASMVTLLALAGRSGWRWRGNDATYPEREVRSPLRRATQWLGDAAHLPRWSLRVAVTGALVYLLGAAALVEPATRDVAWLALALGAALLVLLARSGRSANLAPWTSRAMLYTAAALGVYLDHLSQEGWHVFTTLKVLVLPVLALAVVLRMRLSTERRFEVTTMDVLLVFIALLVPNLPGLQTGPSNLGLSVVKLVVLIYAIELCADQSEVAKRVLTAGVALCSMLIALRGLIP
jgi:UDP-GlcNAc:undecaprenyl-phosphate GlcNAc-1-phosphate transferase